MASFAAQLSIGRWATFRREADVLVAVAVCIEIPPLRSEESRPDLDFRPLARGSRKLQFVRMYKSSGPVNKSPLPCCKNLSLEAGGKLLIGKQQ
jgi:hypothetical protein